MGYRVSNRELLVRRRRSRIFYYSLLGYNDTRIAKLVAEEYGCSERTVKRDLSKKEEWVSSFLPLEDSEIDGFNRIQQDLRILKQRLWSITHDSNVILRIDSWEIKQLDKLGVFAHAKAKKEELNVFEKMFEKILSEEKPNEAR